MLSERVAPLDYNREIFRPSAPKKRTAKARAKRALGKGYQLAVKALPAVLAVVVGHYLFMLLTPSNLKPLTFIAQGLRWALIIGVARFVYKEQKAIKDNN